MTHPTRAGIGLVRLGDSDFVAANPEDDVRGKDAYDAQGQRIGSVSDLYIDPQDREVRFLEVGDGGFLGIGEKNYLVLVEAVVEVAEDRVIIEPGRTEKVEGPAPFDTKVAPLPTTSTGAPTTTPRPHTATPVKPTVAGAPPTQRSRSTIARSSRTVRMRATRRYAHLSEAHHDGGNPDAVWGVRGVMAEAILPDRPAERRKRRRLCAMRAMERLGLWSEENLIPTLAKRPELRWLADEEGARWDVLAELGRIGRRDAFDEAVGWTVMARPRPEEARARFTGAGPGARGKVASRTPPSLPRLSGATRREEGRR